SVEWCPVRSGGEEVRTVRRERARASLNAVHSSLDRGYHTSGESPHESKWRRAGFLRSCCSRSRFRIASRSDESNRVGERHHRSLVSGVGNDCGDCGDGGVSRWFSRLDGLQRRKALGLIFFVLFGPASCLHGPGGGSAMASGSALAITRAGGPYASQNKTGALAPTRRPRR